MKIMQQTHFVLLMKRANLKKKNQKNYIISEPSFGILEKFECSSALPDIKYNWAILFLSQLY